MKVRFGVGSDARADAKVLDLLVRAGGSMYEIVNSGGEVQGVVRDSVCAALANTAPRIIDHCQSQSDP